MYLTQGLHRSLQRTPHAPAVIDGPVRHTFVELGDRVARLAGGLAALGVAEGDRVAMMARNSHRFVEYVFGVLWAGAVINPVNIRWSIEEIAYSLVDSDTRILLVDDEFAPVAEELRARCPRLDAVVHFGRDAPSEGMYGYERLIAAHEPVEDVRRGGDALAGLLYTGGTTGDPKGVMVSHAGLLVSQLGTLAGNGVANAAGRVLHVAPLFHLASLGTLFTHTVLGSTHVLLPTFDVATVAASVQQHEITDITLVPTMIQRLIEHAEHTGTKLSSLRRLGYGASPISEAVLRRVITLLPETQLCQRYGMTELGPVATVLRPDEHAGHRLGSAGRAAPHAEVRVVDADDNDLPAGEVGEIIVRGGNLMLGYWNKPEATAQALAGGWMHTGDAGYLDTDGYLYVVDRIKDVIVTGGENVYSAEVERALATHPAVASCAVIGVPDEEWGERVHAVVVLNPQQTVTIEALRAHCKRFIAGYKAPRTVESVDALPLSPVGKILKRTLRDRYLAYDESPTTSGSAS